MRCSNLNRGSGIGLISAWATLMPSVRCIRGRAANSHSGTTSARHLSTTVVSASITFCSRRSSPPDCRVARSTRFRGRNPDHLITLRSFFSCGERNRRGRSFHSGRRCNANLQLVSQCGTAGLGIGLPLKGTRDLIIAVPGTLYAHRASSNATSRQNKFELRGCDR